jgi:hypothetical protein
LWSDDAGAAACGSGDNQKALAKGGDGTAVHDGGERHQEQSHEHLPPFFFFLLQLEWFYLPLSLPREVRRAEQRGM